MATHHPATGLPARQPALPPEVDGKRDPEDFNKFFEHWRTVASNQGASDEDAHMFAIGIVRWATDPQKDPLPQEYAKYYCEAWIDMLPPPFKKEPTAAPTRNHADGQNSSGTGGQSAPTHVNTIGNGNTGNVTTITHNGVTVSERTPAQQRIGRRSGDCAASPEEHGIGPNGYRPTPTKADVVNGRSYSAHVSPCVGMMPDATRCAGTCLDVEKVKMLASNDAWAEGFATSHNVFLLGKCPVKTPLRPCLKGENKELANLHSFMYQEEVADGEPAADKEGGGDADGDDDVQEVPTSPHGCVFVVFSDKDGIAVCKAPTIGSGRTCRRRVGHRMPWFAPSVSTPCSMLFGLIQQLCCGMDRSLVTGSGDGGQQNTERYYSLLATVLLAVTEYQKKRLKNGGYQMMRMQVDETCLVKRKYGRGDAPRKVTLWWVTATETRLLDDGTEQIVETAWRALGSNRTRAALEEFVKQVSHPDPSLVHLTTDAAKTTMNMRNFYFHEIVNHRAEFCTANGTNTNSAEGMHAFIKRYMKRTNGGKFGHYKYVEGRVQLACLLALCPNADARIHKLFAVLQDMAPEIAELLTKNGEYTHRDKATDRPERRSRDEIDAGVRHGADGGRADDDVYDEPPEPNADDPAYTDVPEELREAMEVRQQYRAKYAADTWRAKLSTPVRDADELDLFPTSNSSKRSRDAGQEASTAAAADGGEALQAIQLAQLAEQADRPLTPQQPPADSSDVVGHAGVRDHLRSTPMKDMEKHRSYAKAPGRPRSKLTRKEKHDREQTQARATQEQKAAAAKVSRILADPNSPEFPQPDKFSPQWCRLHAFEALLIRTLHKDEPIPWPVVEGCLEAMQVAGGRRGQTAVEIIPSDVPLRTEQWLRWDAKLDANRRIKLCAVEAPHFIEGMFLIRFKLPEEAKLHEDVQTRPLSKIIEDHAWLSCNAECDAECDTFEDVAEPADPLRKQVNVEVYDPGMTLGGRYAQYRQQLRSFINFRFPGLQPVLVPYQATALRSVDREADENHDIIRLASKTLYAPSNVPPEQTITREWIVQSVRKLLADKAKYGMPA